MTQSSRSALSRHLKSANKCGGKLYLERINADETFLAGIQRLTTTIKTNKFVGAGEEIEDVNEGQRLSRRDSWPFQSSLLYGAVYLSSHSILRMLLQSSFMASSN